MGANSKIAWTDHTFNPWWGCHKNSPECARCYADSFARRTGHKVWGESAPRRFFGEKHWAEPLKWNRHAKEEGVRKRVFCGSMCDVMEAREDLVASRERLYSLIEKTEWLDWLLLTKFPKHFGVFLPQTWLRRPLHNVWGMTTVGCKSSLWRVTDLLSVPFVIHGLSCEPLLEELDLSLWLDPLGQDSCPHCGADEQHYIDPDDKNQIEWTEHGDALCTECGSMRGATGYDPGIDWVIAGAESGPGARPMNEDWVRSLRDQCIETKTAFFYKQKMDEKGHAIETPLLGGRQWTEFPETPND